MISVALLALLLADDPPAEDKKPPEPPRVHEEMVVTAERGPEPREQIPASVDVLTREEIQRLPARDLSELMEFLPGFHAFFRESFGGPPPILTSRGFFGGGEAEYVQLRVDGVPVEDVETGVVDWRRIRVEDIERVEALRGPASSLYGDTALGGVIQVFTRKGPSSGHYGSVSASGGSFGTAAADLAWGFGSDNFQGLATGTYFRTDGYREHSEEESGILGFATSGPLAGGKWSFDVEGSRTLRDDPGALNQLAFDRDDRQSDPIFRFDHTDTDRGRLALSFRKDAGAVPYQFTLYGAARGAGILRTLLVLPGVGNRTFRDLHSGTFGGIFQGDKALTLFGRTSQIRAGIEAGRETLSTTYAFVNDEGVKGPIVTSEDGGRNRFAAFVTGDIPITERLRASLGVRWDRIDDDFHARGSDTHDAWSPRGGLNFRIGNLDRSPVAIYFQASHSFKAATLDQLFDPHPFEDFQGGTFTISNPNLVPQEADNYEFGISQQGERLRWEVLTYRMNVDNEIDFDPATFSYQNIGRSLHQGVEASARLSVGAFSPFLSYAWTRVESRTGEHEGKQLKNIPEQLLRAGLAVTLPAGFEASAIWTYLAERWLDDDNLIPLGNASVVDLRVAKSFGPLRARLDISNLTNTKYSQYGFGIFGFEGEQVPYYYPGARIGARVGVDWRIGGP